MPRPTDFSQPLTFEPLFMERIWGGRLLETLFGKKLPAGVPIGESWEIVDRPEAQSVVRDGPWRGKTLNDLWQHHRPQFFGRVADAPRFPLLLKLLDAREKLSVQVHPPAAVAAELGGESKTELWYVADAQPSAEIYVGLRKQTSRDQFEAALKSGNVEELLHRVSVRTGDAMFLPSGRLHAIGAGNVIIEVQENSDTTYRLFDWNRTTDNGSPRALHLDESLRSIDFDDYEPSLIDLTGESLIQNKLFDVDKWDLVSERDVSPPGSFAIVICLTGEIGSAGVRLKPGEFSLFPASLPDRVLRPKAPDTTLLRVSIQTGRAA